MEGWKIACSSSSSKETVHPIDVARFGAHLDVTYGELGRVQDDPIDGLVHGDIDRHGPRKGGRADIGLNLQPVDVWLHGPRETKGILRGRRWGQWGR